MQAKWWRNTLFASESHFQDLAITVSKVLYISGSSFVWDHIVFCVKWCFLMLVLLHNSCTMTDVMLHTYAFSWKCKNGYTINILVSMSNNVMCWKLIPSYIARRDKYSVGSVGVGILYHLFYQCVSSNMIHQIRSILCSIEHNGVISTNHTFLLFDDCNKPMCWWQLSMFDQTTRLFLSLKYLLSTLSHDFSYLIPSATTMDTKKKNVVLLCHLHSMPLHGVWAISTY